VWIIHPSAGIGNPGYLVRIDPISFRRRVNTIGSPVALAVDDSAVWILDVSGAVSRFDPSSRRTVARIGSANGASGIAVGEGGVWVFHRLKGSMIRIDPEAGTAGDPIAVGGSPSSVAVGEGLVWVRLDGAL
jgi:streptogramin lyase